ncbi:hypothetical protein CISIN_1g047132mg, partial [Citrus sinensis]
MGFKIGTTKWLTKQACAFRGHDELVNSLNHGNFIELIKLLAKMNEEINKISTKIQKKLLNIIANKVQHKIQDEVDTKFCIIVDEALDESHKEQMAIILKYVDCDDETKALSLKNEICSVLAQCNLLLKVLRGQGYDGASNMIGKWNELRYLFLNDCSYAYYVHCFAHRLQKLNSIVNFPSASSKCYFELKSASEKEIIYFNTLEELETNTTTNQVRTLQGLEIHVGAHILLHSVLDLIDEFKSFDIDNICSLAEKVYPHDFTPNEVLALRRELEQYKIDVLSNPWFQNIASFMSNVERFIERK